MLTPIYNPGAIEEFVDLVVPELQRRGRFRTAYTGTTQRDHFRRSIALSPAAVALLHGVRGTQIEHRVCVYPVRRVPN